MEAALAKPFDRPPDQTLSEFSDITSGLASAGDTLSTMLTYCRKPGPMMLLCRQYYSVA